MFRRISVVLVLAVLLAAFVPVKAQTAAPTAGTIVVTNLNSDGQGSLLEAITNAQSDNEITFSPGLIGTIFITQNLVLSKNLSILSEPSSVTINKTDFYPMFTVTSGVAFHMQGLTFAPGSTGNLIIDNGGGHVFVKNTQFDGFPHGIILNKINSDLHIDKSTFTSSPKFSAPLIQNYGYLSVSNSTFSDNTAAILNNFGNVDISSSTFVNNLEFGFTPIINGNTGNINIINCTFTKNGGFLTNAGIVNLENDTISQNNVFGISTMKMIGPPYGTIAARNSIFEGLANCDRALVDQGGNLQFPNNDCGPSIKVGDPKLGPLMDNGGGTQTMALLTGSAAARIGSCKAATNHIDQRGIARPETCDAGAVQVTNILSGTSQPTVQPVK